MPTRLQIARKDIYRHFDEQKKNVFQKPELQKILEENRQHWRLAQKTTSEEFIRFLKGPKRLSAVTMKFPSRKETRFIWRDATPAEIVLTLRPRCHFSHYTAMQMHNLTEQDSKTLYINYEQSPKPPGSSLTQESIDRAFRGKQRTTNMIAELDDYRVCLLNGKNTGYLGVEERSVAWGKTDKAITVRLTDVERTLIDIVVRPAYAGGPDEVLKAYARTDGRASANRIAAYLQKMKYGYPYHQTIGFYMDKSGAFTEAAVELFRQRFEIEFDFYLTYQLKEPSYNERWQLYVPRWMQPAN